MKNINIIYKLHYHYLLYVKSRRDKKCYKYKNNYCNPLKFFENEHTIIKHKSQYHMISYIIKIININIK